MNFVKADENQPFLFDYTLIELLYMIYFQGFRESSLQKHTLGKTVNLNGIQHQMQKGKRLVAGSIFALCIAALFFQVVGMPVLSLTTIFRLASYFTILSTLFLCVSMFGLMINRELGVFTKPGFLISLSISCVFICLFYNLILRLIFFPEDLLFIADEIFHVLIPITVFVFSLLYYPTSYWDFKQFWKWLVYPLIYLVLVLLYGSISHFYPYPFLNIMVHGWAKVVLTSLMITLLFMILSLVLKTIASFIQTKLNRRVES